MRYSAAFLVFSAFVFLSCASGNFARLDSAVEQERFDHGVEMLETSRNALYSPSRDMTLYFLDKGMISHYARQYEVSAELLGSGERAIEEAFTKSITRGVGSYLLNDNVLEYAGEDYEDIYVNAFNALNYHHQGNDEGAMVEIRRINNKLAYLATKYDTLVSEMQQQALAEGVDEIPANPNAPSQFSDSALARFLGMLFYRANGLEDDARIDRDALKIAFANAPSVYKNPVPSSVDAELEIPVGQSRVNVIAFSGLAPVKRALDLRIPLPGPRWVKISLPELEARPSAVEKIEVVFEDGRRFSLELLEDMNAVASETFKNRQNYIYTKTIVRAALKAGSSSAMAIASEETEGTTSTVLNILSLAAQAFAEASEFADVRVSRYFPGKAWVGGINVEPGIYSFRVDFRDASGRVLVSRRFDNVSAGEKGLNLIEAACLR